MNFKKTLFAGLLATVAATASQAATIVGYDIRNADPATTTGWTHTYDGQTTPSADGIPGLVDLTGGGSGTLNDGILPQTVSNNQLFLSNFAIQNASITLFFDDLIQIGSIDFLNDDLFSSRNGIPATIQSATAIVGGGDIFETVAGDGFGPIGLSGTTINTRFDFTGSSISEFAVDSITLSNFFVERRSNNLNGAFSIGEIVVTEAQVAPVPLPASGVLMLAGIGGLIAARRRKNT